MFNSRGYDVYMVTLYPKAVGKSNDYVLFEQGSDAYNKNKGLDLNGDGKKPKKRLQVQLY